MDASFWEVAVPAGLTGFATPITIGLINMWRLKRWGVTKENIAIIGSNASLYNTLTKRLSETEERLDIRITQCENLIKENTRLNAEVDSLRITIADREVKIADRDAKIADRDQKIAERDLKLAERDVTIKGLESRIGALEEENKRHTVIPVPVTVVDPVISTPAPSPRKKRRRGGARR